MFFDMNATSHLGAKSQKWNAYKFFHFRSSEKSQYLLIQSYVVEYGFVSVSSDQGRLLGSSLDHTSRIRTLSVPADTYPGDPNVHINLT